MNLISIVGARPQFIKAAVVSRAIEDHNRQLSDSSHAINEIIVHTGQHYDRNMSQIFFDELDIPKPQINLGVGSGLHGQMTAAMLGKIEKILLQEKPDCVLVYGDTNSTLAGALAAVKLHITLAHVEAGLRSYNRIMPEEINRVLTDHMSNILFCPTETAVRNLEAEGIGGGNAITGKLVSSSARAQELTNLRTHQLINSETHQLTQKVYLVGDVMFDSVLYNLKLASQRSKIIENLKLKPKAYALATIHRAENADNIQRLNSIFTALEQMASDRLAVIVPLHPRTQSVLHNSDFTFKSVNIIDPVSYLDMLILEKQAKMILTDSGGVQKEAFFSEVPCLTLRNETEWPETLNGGWNRLVGAQTDTILEEFEKLNAKHPNPVSSFFGDGHSGKKIISILSPEYKQGC